MSWRVARSLNVLLDQLNTAAPDRNRLSDGSIGDADHSSRLSDHNPDRHGIVRARDYTHDPGRGADMHRLAGELVASRDPRIKYVIWNRRIASGAAGPDPWAWRSYAGTNPHTSHLHLSVVADQRADQTHRWALPSLEDDMPLSDADLTRIETIVDRKMRQGVRYLDNGDPDRPYQGHTTAKIRTELAALRGLVARQGGLTPEMVTAAVRAGQPSREELVGMIRDALADGGQEVTQDTVEAAIRSVLGSLDTQEATP